MTQKTTGEHVLERRSHLLAQRIQQRISDMALSLQAADGRIPFRTKLSKSDALDWWAEHRYDALGQQALNGLSPLDIAKLDNALTSRVQNQTQGIPLKSSPSGPTGSGG